MADAMARCPFNARTGAHHLAFVIPEDDEHDLLLVCERCGSVKRVPITTPRPLDDLSAEDILAQVKRAP